MREDLPDPLADRPLRLELLAARRIDARRCAVHHDHDLAGEIEAGEVVPLRVALRQPVTEKDDLPLGGPLCRRDTGTQVDQRYDLSSQRDRANAPVLLDLDPRSGTEHLLLHRHALNEAAVA